MLRDAEDAAGLAGKAENIEVETIGLENVLGCLLGGAVGDALGYPIEFLKKDAIIAQFGRNCPLALPREPDRSEALISDDTQMTLFTVEGMLRARSAGVDVCDARWPAFLLGAYQRWYLTQQMRPTPPLSTPQTQGPLLADARMHARRGPGGTCLSALARSFVTPELPGPTSPPNFSKGCGAIMRSAPFGIFADSRETAFEQARIAGSLTHGHPTGHLAAGYFASLVFDVARGADLETAMALADARLALQNDCAEVADAVDRARQVAAAPQDSSEDVARLGEGWIAEETLAIALFCALRYRRSAIGFTTALWEAVAHDGDSDSTGGLAGALIGASAGASAIPTAWQVQLELRDVIRQLAEDLHAVAHGARPDADRYPPVHGCLTGLSG